MCLLKIHQLPNQLILAVIMSVHVPNTTAFTINLTIASLYTVPFILMQHKETYRFHEDAETKSQLTFQHFIELIPERWCSWLICARPQKLLFTLQDELFTVGLLKQPRFITAFLKTPRYGGRTRCPYDDISPPLAFPEKFKVCISPIFLNDTTTSK